MVRIPPIILVTYCPTSASARPRNQRPSTPTDCIIVKRAPVSGAQALNTTPPDKFPSRCRLNRCLQLKLSQAYRQFAVLPMVCVCVRTDGRETKKEGTRDAPTMWAVRCRGRLAHLTRLCPGGECANSCANQGASCESMLPTQAGPRNPRWRRQTCGIWSMSLAGCRPPEV